MRCRRSRWTRRGASSSPARRSGQIVVARFLPNGALDEAFHGGRTRLSVSTASTVCAVLVQPDGKIVLAGTSAGVFGDNTTLARLDSTGTPDPGFGTDGVLVADPCSATIARARSCASRTARCSSAQLTNVTLGEMFFFSPPRVRRGVPSERHRRADVRAGRAPHRGSRLLHGRRAERPRAGPAGPSGDGRFVGGHDRAGRLQSGSSRAWTTRRPRRPPASRCPRPRRTRPHRTTLAGRHRAPVRAARDLRRGGAAGAHHRHGRGGYGAHADTWDLRDDDGRAVRAGLSARPSARAHRSCGGSRSRVEGRAIRAGRARVDEERSSIVWKGLQRARSPNAAGAGGACVSGSVRSPHASHRGMPAGPVRAVLHWYPPPTRNACPRPRPPCSTAAPRRGSRPPCRRTNFASRTREHVGRLFSGAIGRTTGSWKSSRTREIDQRHICVPIRVVRHRSRLRREERAVEHAVRLASEVTRKALALAGLDPVDVDHVVFVSSTGLDPEHRRAARQRARLPPDVRRADLGVSAARAARGFAQARDFTRSPIRRRAC